VISDLIGAIKARQQQIASALAAGNAPTFDAYQRMVGEHMGLQHALQMIDNLLLDKDEDE